MTVIINGTTGITGASWTTAGRPTSPVSGQQGYNTTLGVLEVFTGSSWHIITGSFSATGGAITTNGGYTIHTFTSSGTFIPNEAGIVDYLVVAGGGGGGWFRGGGGGAGGFRAATGFNVTPIGLTVTVGAGGSGVSGSNSNGSNSVFSSIESIGGGRGGNLFNTAGTTSSGGSGGGGGGYGASGTPYVGGAGTAGQGNAGGAGYVGGEPFGGGGGGGASEVGGNNVIYANGGAGTVSSISGSAVTYAGGGGSGGYNGSVGTGGAGGGGTGVSVNGTSGGNGIPNTGGGGGGGPNSSGNGGNGGSGIVIIKYLTGSVAALSDTVGTVASVNMLQTRTQDSYTGATTGNGTVITPLNITFTPKKAGNKVILEFTVNGDGDQDQVFVVSRNDTLLADSTNASNNRWAGIATGAYDDNVSSTPSNYSIRILDLNTLATESTYKVQVRSSGVSAKTFYLNRTANNGAGQDDYEATLSLVTATEIWA
jgi:hypothetical protein